MNKQEIQEFLTSKGFGVIEESKDKIRESFEEYLKRLDDEVSKRPPKNDLESGFRVAIKIIYARFQTYK